MSSDASADVASVEFPEVGCSGASILDRPIKISTLHAPPCTMGRIELSFELSDIEYDMG